MITSAADRKGANSGREKRRRSRPAAQNAAGCLRAKNAELPAFSARILRQLVNGVGWLPSSQSGAALGAAFRLAAWLPMCQAAGAREGPDWCPRGTLRHALRRPQASAHRHAEARGVTARRHDSQHAAPGVRAGVRFHAFGGGSQPESDTSRRSLFKEPASEQAIRGLKTRRFRPLTFAGPLQGRGIPRKRYRTVFG